MQCDNDRYDTYAFLESVTLCMRYGETPRRNPKQTKNNNIWSVSLSTRSSSISIIIMLVSINITITNGHIINNNIVIMFAVELLRVGECWDDKLIADNTNDNNNIIHTVLVITNNDNDDNNTTNNDHNDNDKSMHQGTTRHPAGTVR